MNDKVYQTIFDEISDLLPAGWKAMVFYAIYGAGSYSMKFYYEKGNKEYIDCFHLPNIGRGQIIQLFIKIDKLLAEARSRLEEEKKWTVLSMRVDSEGHMKTEYEYDNHSEDMVAYESTWEKKHLI